MNSITRGTIGKVAFALALVALATSWLFRLGLLVPADIGPALIVMSSVALLLGILTMVGRDKSALGIATTIIAALATKLVLEMMAPELVYHWFIKKLVLVGVALLFGMLAQAPGKKRGLGIATTPMLALLIDAGATQIRSVFMDYLRVHFGFARMIALPYSLGPPVLALGIMVLVPTKFYANRAWAALGGAVATRLTLYADEGTMWGGLFFQMGLPLGLLGAFPEAPAGLSELFGPIVKLAMYTFAVGVVSGLLGVLLIVKVRRARRQPPRPVGSFIQ